MVEVEDVRTGAIEKVAGDLVIGADGAFSAVRARLARRDRYDYSQAFLEHAYKELTIPPAEGGGHRMRAQRDAHLAPRRLHDDGDGQSRRVLHGHALPAVRGAGRLRPAQDAGRRDALLPGAVSRTRFRYIPDLAEAFFANPTGSLVTVRCAPVARRGQGGAPGRRGTRRGAVLRPGGERLVRGLPVARGPASGTRPTGAPRSRPTRPTGSPTPTRWRTSRSTISARCATGSHRRSFCFRKKFEKFLNKLMPRDVHSALPDDFVHPDPLRRRRGSGRTASGGPSRTLARRDAGWCWSLVVLETLWR